ncbi:MAG: hypothetical protein DWG76_06220 [Chloroflexi bacterium]|nr:hypothetical protein [Chloroflexota bacterium]
MRDELLIGLGVAIVAGSMIAFQTTFISRSGAVVGDVRSGMFTAITGAVFASAVLIYLWRGGLGDWHWDGSTWTAMILAGVMGTIIVTGISYASQRVGITATLAGLFLGQMLISSFVDARGLGGSAEVIPFTLTRFMGITLLGFGIYLLLFRR